MVFEHENGSQDSGLLHFGTFMAFRFVLQEEQTGDIR